MEVRLQKMVFNMQKILQVLNEGRTTTTNGALAFNRYGGTLNANVMLFGEDLRFKTPEELVQMLQNAYYEDRRLFLQNVAHIIDIRGGKGERRAARLIVGFLATVEPQWFCKQIEVIVNLSRWDVIFSNVDNFNTEQLQAIKRAVFSTNVSALMFKWLPSINTSSQMQRDLAQKWCRIFGLTKVQYRKWLVAGRKKCKLIETALAQKQMENVKVEQIPKKALMKYHAALNRKIGDQMIVYYNQLRTGQIKSDWRVVNPVDLVLMINRGKVTADQIDTLWEQLPDWLAKDFNFFPVIDVSGSMTNRGGLPIAVAQSLGIYAAEKNKGPFANKLMLFSDDNKVLVFEPQDRFSRKLAKVKNFSDIANTNLAAVWEKFYEMALLVPNDLKQACIPKAICLISDGQFDAMVDDANNTTILRHYQTKFQAANLPWPQIIYWNINGQGRIPFNHNDQGMVMISGYSPQILSAFQGQAFEMVALMQQVLARYANTFN